MKHPRPATFLEIDFPLPGTTLYLQAPLPNFAHTLPILLTIPGQGSVLAGCAPSAPPEEPANDK